MKKVLLLGLLIALLLPSVSNAQIGVTPLMWMQYKHYENRGILRDYYVTGYWWTDGDYWHKGHVRTFEVNFSVYSRLLVPNATGHIDERLCKLAFKDYDDFASGLVCWPSYEVMLPRTGMR